MRPPWLRTTSAAPDRAGPSGSAAFIKLIIVSSVRVEPPYSARPRRSRISLTRTVVQVSPSPVLQRIRLHSLAHRLTGERVDRNERWRARHDLRRGQDPSEETAPWSVWPT
jgi:hypothetical protein